MTTGTLSPNFSWAEATVTSTGLPNIPTPEEQARIRNTAQEMQIVRAVLKRRPIKINSWFRSPQVNAKVGGSKTSEHAVGAAVDFVCPSFGTPYEICQSLIAAAHILNYNQLIYEQTWVHISFPPAGQVGKNEVLTYKNRTYSKGLVK